MNTAENKSIAYLSLGSNLGDREENLKKAITLLSRQFKVLDQSNIYETSPLELEDQGDFLNMVVKIETDIDPNELLWVTQKIEKDLKRIRSINNGPRTIDIDIIYFDDIVRHDKKLKVPHKKMDQRAFVLKPLSEIDNNYRNPLNKKKSSTMLKEISKKQHIKLWKKTR